MNYQHIDEAIVAAIRRGNTKFYEICSEVNPERERIVDRRLQSMRKRGVVQFHSKNGWRVLP